MNTFWKKKTIISYSLSVLVFWIHISTFANYKIDGNRFVRFFQILFTKTLNPVAVPLFFIISGCLFFRDYSIENYLKKIRNRVKTLIVPYLLWNTIAMLFNMVISFTPLTKYFVNREVFQFSFLNIVESVFFYKYNKQFWFIFDLIVFQLCSPLFFVFQKNKYVGVASILLLLILQFFNIGIPESLFFSNVSIIYYLIGCFIGIHYWNAFSNTDESKKTYAILHVLFFFCLLYSFFSNWFSFSFPEITVPFLAFFGLIIWKMIDPSIEKTKDRDFYSNSFLVYAMHVDVSAIITKSIYLLLPKTPIIAVINFLLSTVITLFVIQLFAILVKRMNSSFFAILSGNR